MRRLIIQFLVALLTFAIGVTITMIWVVPHFQSADSSTNSPSLQVAVTPPPAAEVEPSPSPTPNSPIRAIDFANFTYPAKPIYSESKKSFTLRNGRYEGRYRGVYDIPYPVSLAGLVYGDVTGDEIEEAMIVLFENVKGTAIPYYVYIYALKKGSPKLLWSFETGDRADGGLRRVYADNGELVIELYGKGKMIGRDLYADDGGACCPSHFTRTRYVRGSNRFRQKGKEEILPNPARHGSLEMPDYP